MNKENLIDKLPRTVPFGYWKGSGESHQFNVGLNHLIFLDLSSLLGINTDINLLRFYAKEEHNEELLFDGNSMSSDNAEDQLKRVEKSFMILESKGVDVDERIKAKKDFFSFLSLHSFYGNSLSGIVILKAVEVGQTSPEVLQRNLVLPEYVKLIPAKMAYQIAFLLSHCMTENFMKVFDLYQILIMNEPLEKSDPNDNNLTVSVSPPRKKEGLGPVKAKIGLNLFDNPYTINKGDGLCFLCFQSTIKERGMW
ncbi:MAG: hypothetical protein WCO58_00865 [bacterium]